MHVADEAMSRKHRPKAAAKSNKNEGLFHGETAWFSSSVTKRYINQWCKNGGELANEDSALFIFSEDPATPDTLEIFCSDAYLNQHVAVIHPSYIRECVEANDRTRVVLLDHSLPAESLKNEVSLRVRSRHTDNDSVLEASQMNHSTRQHPKRPSTNTTRLDEKKKISKQYYDISEMAKVTGIIEDFIPGQNGCEVLMK